MTTPPPNTRRQLLARLGWCLPAPEVPWRSGHLLVSTLLLLAVTTTATAQNQLVGYLQSNQVSKRGVGSAAHLKGKIHVYQVFVSDTDSKWEPDERQEALRKMRSAYEFIQREATKTGVGIEFNETVGRDIRFEGALPKTAFGNPTWTERVIEASSGRTGNQLVRTLRDEGSAQNTIVCLHVNKSALSYNLAYYENVAQDFLAERMICFRSYPDGRPTAAATYAHEILHLFGAGDLYFPYDPDASRKQRAAQMFPDDVMYRVDYDLEHLNVGLFTAYRVGWVDNLKPAFALFED